MNRIKYSVGNWKMNTNLDEALSLAEKIKGVIGEFDKVRTVICPPYVWLHPLEGVVGRSEKFSLGAQNMHCNEKGAFTGEISPLMLKELVEYVIVGHSERRHKFGESEELINEKVKKALESGFKTILCVGELKKSEEGSVGDEVVSQLNQSLSGVEAEQLDNLIIAYEPVWAISNNQGVGDPATGAYAEEIIAKIRCAVAEAFGDEKAENISILYGGSVDPDNIKDYVERDGIDGVLVGGASLKADGFIEISRAVNQVEVSEEVLVKSVG